MPYELMQKSEGFPASLLAMCNYVVTVVVKYLPLLRV